MVLIKNKKCSNLILHLSQTDISSFVPQVSSHSNKKSIAEFTPTPEGFLNKYDDCQARNIKVLDPLGESREVG